MGPVRVVLVVRVRETGRRDWSAEGSAQRQVGGGLLHTLLKHLACRHAPRETVVRARKASLANLSDLALLEPLRKSRALLHALCEEVFREQGFAVPGAGGIQVRTFDATTMKEPGKTGSLWRIHCSVSLPSLTCSFFKLTATERPSTGESSRQFAIRAGDYILADRGYSTSVGVGHASAAGGHGTVRVTTGPLRMKASAGPSFDLLGSVSTLARAGTVGSWPA